MTDQLIAEQAALVTSLLPKLVRQLFILDVNDPTIELPVSQLRVCGILSLGPRSMSMLSRDLGISLSAVTQIADRLERAKLVERIAEEDDRRVKSLQLTPHGSAVMQARRERRIRRVQQVMQQVAPDAREHIVQSLRLLLDASLAVMPETPGEATLKEAMEA